MVLTKYTNNMRKNDSYNLQYKDAMILHSLLIIFGKPLEQKNIVLMCYIQRQTDTYNNKATYSQPMYFCQIDVKIDEISISTGS